MRISDWSSDVCSSDLFDQVWRTANRAHRPVILFLAVGVAMHEHRHVAPRECGLMVRDRVERDTRFRDDAFAVALRDSSVILDPFGLKTALTHARRCGADLVLRLKVDALRFVAAMIYAGVHIQFRKPIGKTSCRARLGKSVCISGGAD